MRIILIIFLISFCLISLGQSVTFEKRIGPTEGWDVVQTYDSGYAITGSTPGGVLFYKVDKYGDSLWKKVYDLGFGEIGTSIFPTSDSGFIISGSIFISGQLFQILIIRTDSIGDTLWTRNYGDNGIDDAYSVLQTNDGGFILCGSTDFYPNVVKIDSMGDTLWTRHIFVDALLSIKQTYDGGYSICGWVGSGYPNSYYLTKLDSAGNVDWEKFFYNPYEDEFDDVIQTPDSGFIATGGIARYVIKVNAQGDSLWAVTLPGSGWAIDNTTDGGFISIGGGPSGMLLIKCDSVGGIVWSKTFNLSGTALTTGYSVKHTSDGGYIASGFATISGDQQVYLVKTDSLGNVYTGINENEPEKTQGMVYPNPITDVGYLLLVNQNYSALKNSSFILYDVTGKELRNEKIVSFPFKIERKDLKSGMYFYRVADEKGLMVSGKIIMQ